MRKVLACLAAVVAIAGLLLPAIYFIDLGGLNLLGEVPIKFIAGSAICSLVAIFAVLILDSD